MKKTKFTCLALATALLVSSCNSSYQASSGATGAMIGSHVGGAIGVLSGHGYYRGNNAALGSLIGMGIGAVLGVGIASQIEEKEKAEARRYEQVPVETRVPSVVNISELSYMDSNGDGYISKDETIEVEGFVTNSTKSILQDIVISLKVSDPKAFSTSPSLTTTLLPGQKIRYTGRIHCNRIHRNESVGVNMEVAYANRNSTSTSLFVPVR